MQKRQTLRTGHVRARRWPVVLVATALSFAALAPAPTLAVETWHGLDVASEPHRSPYDRPRDESQLPARPDAAQAARSPPSVQTVG